MACKRKVAIVDVNNETQEKTCTASGDDDGSDSKRRRRNESPSPSVSANQATSVSETELPPNTSNWSQKHLELIGIHADLNTIHDPLMLIKNYKFKFIGDKYGCFEDKVLDSTFLSITRTCMVSFMEKISLNYERIEELSTNDVKILGTEVKQWLDNGLNNAKTDEERDIVLKTGYSAERFITQLGYMVIDSREGNLPLDGMYQQLLQEYLAICGIKAFAKPNIRSSNLKVKEENVVSTPDMLVFTLNDNLPTSDVLLVCEAKRPYSEVCQQSQVCTTSKEQQKKNQQRKKQHISSDLIGQHTGGLLSYIPHSAFGEKGLFGMMYQGTKVCFALLDPEEGFLLQLEHRTSVKKKAKVLISDEYNILSHTDRKTLVKPLMELLYMQEFMHEVGF